MKSTGGPFSIAAANLRQIRHSPASWSVVVLILTVHLLLDLLGGTDLQPARSVYETFGLNREGILAGKLWQIPGHALLHGPWWHAILNALLVLLIGSRIEHMVGRRIMLLTALVGVLGGAIGHLLLAAGEAGSPLLVGFSGGCIALLLMLTTLSPESRMMPLPVSGRSLGLGILITSLVLSLINPALNLQGNSNIEMGHACHFGGGMAGWLYGRWLLRPRITLNRLRADRKRREANESRGV